MSCLYIRSVTSDVLWQVIILLEVTTNSLEGRDSESAYYIVNVVWCHVLKQKGHSPSLLFVNAIAGVQLEIKEKKIKRTTTFFQCRPNHCSKLLDSIFYPTLPRLTQLTSARIWTINSRNSTQDFGTFLPDFKAASGTNRNKYLSWWMSANLMVCTARHGMLLLVQEQVLYCHATSDKLQQIFRASIN